MNRIVIPELDQFGFLILIELSIIDFWIVLSTLVLLRAEGTENVLDIRNFMKARPFSSQ